MNIIHSNSTAKVKQGGDERTTKTVQSVRPGVREEANAVSPKKWGWNKRTLLIFAFAFIITLIITAPATLLQGWMQHASQGQLVLANTSGTVWHGSATPALPQREVGFIALGRLHWDVALLPLFSGKLKIILRWDDVPQTTAMEAILSSNGLELNHAQLALPAAALGEISPLLQPVQLQGQIQIQSEHLLVSSQGIEGVANADWINAGSALSAVNPLGKYHLTFTGAGERLHIALATTSGALVMDGQGDWSQARGLEFHGKARAAEGKQDSLAELLAHLGPEQTAGVHTLTLTPQAQAH